VDNERGTAINPGEAVEEKVSLSDRFGLWLGFHHCGQDEYLDMIEDARARGLDVTANEYPYTAMNHGWSAFFPVWAREGGPAAFAARLKDPAVRAKIKADKDFNTWAREHGWWEGIVMGRGAEPRPSARWRHR